MRRFCGDDPIECALERLAPLISFIGADLTRHVDKPLGLGRIVRLWLRLAGHGHSIHRRGLFVEQR